MTTDRRRQPSHIWPLGRKQLNVLREQKGDAIRHIFRTVLICVFLKFCFWYATISCTFRDWRRNCDKRLRCRVIAYKQRRRSAVTETMTVTCAFIESLWDVAKNRDCNDCCVWSPRPCCSSMTTHNAAAIVARVRRARFPVRDVRYLDLALDTADDDLLPTIRAFHIGCSVDRGSSSGVALKRKLVRSISLSQYYSSQRNRRAILGNSECIVTHNNRTAVITTSQGIG